jgi:DNA-binding GntR family transcriptional regulator
MRKGQATSLSPQRIAGGRRGSSEGVPLKQVDSTPLHERVYSEIRQALIMGRFEPGQRLTVRWLADALGTSPMPVRAALSRLVAERALAQLGKRNVAVPLVSRESFQDLMETRILLEGHATGRACSNIDPRALQDIRKLGKQLTACVERRNIVEYLEFNQAFKFSIYRHCGSPTLLDLIELLWLQVGPCLRYLASDIPGLHEINYHDRAIAAIERRQPEKATEAISRDIREGMLFLLQTAQFSARADEEAAGDDRRGHVLTSEATGQL